MREASVREPPRLLTETAGLGSGLGDGQVAIVDLVGRGVEAEVAVSGSMVSAVHALEHHPTWLMRSCCLVAAVAMLLLLSCCGCCDATAASSRSPLPSDMPRALSPVPW